LKKRIDTADVKDRTKLPIILCIFDAAKVSTPAAMNRTALAFPAACCGECERIRK
jgi:hypothetical protein